MKNLFLFYYRCSGRIQHVHSGRQWNHKEVKGKSQGERGTVENSKGGVKKRDEL